MPQRSYRVLTVAALLGALLAGSGCHLMRVRRQVRQCDAPRELEKGILPPYIIEIPDMLLVEAVRLMPPPDYQLQPMDVLGIEILGTPTGEPFRGSFQVEADGYIDLGSPFGPVAAEDGGIRIFVKDMTVDEAKSKINERLKEILAEPGLSVSLVSSGPQQQIAGPHLVTPDGTIRLGIYGAVPVVGLTIDEAREAIEKHLSKDFYEPQVNVDVQGYNSKVYYVITQGATQGDQARRMPITGNETVLDAITEMGGLGPITSKPPRIWIARPCPGGNDYDEMLAVNWKAITRRGDTRTNYQLLPGDRLYIASDRLTAFQNTVARITAPLEQAASIAMFGTSVASRFSGNVLQGGSDQRDRLYGF